MSVRIKEVVFQYGDGAPQLLARFRLDGETLTSEWLDDAFRAEIEDRGIIGPVGDDFKQLWPKDGRVFFETLDIVYSQSSTILVQDVESPT